MCERSDDCVTIEIEWRRLLVSSSILSKVFVFHNDPIYSKDQRQLNDALTLHGFSCMRRLKYFPSP